MTSYRMAVIPWSFVFDGITNTVVARKNIQASLDPGRVLSSDVAGTGRLIQTGALVADGLVPGRVRLVRGAAGNFDVGWEAEIAR